MMKWILLLAIFISQSVYPVLQKLKLTEDQTNFLRQLTGNNAKKIDLGLLFPGNYVACVQDSYYRIETNNDIQKLMVQNGNGKISFFAFPMAQMYQFYKVDENDTEYRVHHYSGVDYSCSPEYQAEIKKQQEEKNSEENKRKLEAERKSMIEKVFALVSKSDGK